MTGAILPPDAAAMLVMYAIDRKRDAKMFREAGCHAHAADCERKARRAREIVADHDEALAARVIEAERRAGLRHVFPEARLERSA